MIERRTMLAALAASCLPRPLPAASPVDMRVAGDRLFVPARLNTIETEALLDSAAELTLVSPAFAARTGLSGGSSVAAHGSGVAAMAARLIEGATLVVAGRTLVITIAVIDLDDIGRRLIGHPVDLIVGREIFDAAALEIDIDAGRFRPTTTLPGRSALPLTSKDGTDRMPILIEGKPVQAEFDLGNGAGLLIGRAFAARAGLIDGRPIGQASGGGLGGARVRETLVVRDVEIAGRRFRDMRASVDDSAGAADANIGVDILRHFHITTDFPHHRLWLTARPQDRG